MIVPIYKDYKTKCNNYRGISLLFDAFKTLFIIFLSGLNIVGGDS
jgi:hypothetical protein